ncbi:MAG: tetratricopeptide repeat protein [Vicinamibacterales bacterium]
MKTSERHRLKDNDFANAITSAQGWFGEHQQTLLVAIAAIVIVGGSVGGYLIWQGSVDSKSRTMLAEAMVVEESRIAPPGPPAGTTTDPNAVGGQAPGTYPTEKAKLEAALPKFLAAADAYPTKDAGIEARYHAASVLVGLGRFDDAIKQYDQVIGTGNSLIARMSKLGKAEAQLRAGQFDPAIASLKQLAEAKDAGLPADGLLMELARAYRQAGKHDDANKTFKQIVDQHADSQFAVEAKAELEKVKS